MLKTIRYRVPVAILGRALGEAPERGLFLGILVNRLLCYGSFTQARSSVGERFLDTEEVGSSILPVPTIF